VSGRLKNRYSLSAATLRESRRNAQLDVLCYLANKHRKNHIRLYHLYNAATDDHIFTTSEAEVREYKKNSGWKDGPIAVYAMPHACPDHVPLFRAYNKELGDHLYTTDIREVDKKGPKITKKQLESLIREQLKGYCHRKFNVYLPDKLYFCTTEKVADVIISGSDLIKRRVRGQSFDCTEFAHLLKAEFIDDIYYERTRSMPYAFGMLWGQSTKGGHAVNFIVVSEGHKGDFKLILIEPPQEGEPAKKYFPSDGYMKSIKLAIC
jgi:hypothetical protein